MPKKKKTNGAFDKTEKIYTSFDITESRQMEATLRSREALLKNIVNHINMCVVLIGPDMEILSANRKTRMLFPNVDYDSKPHCYNAFSCQSSVADGDCAVRQTFKDGCIHETTTERETAEGIKHFRTISSPIKDGEGNITSVVAMAEDITEQLLAEKRKEKMAEQLRQAAKMEAVGRLAGGVAHDFNNMLSVILGYAELIKLKLGNDPSLLKEIIEIEKAAKRSRDTTRQLLAFSRKQNISPQILDLNRHISRMKNTLSRLIGEDIILRFYEGEDLWAIKCDPLQIDEILVNLSINARDAMPRGGNLTIETANSSLDGAYCLGHMGLSSGDYVQLCVSDNGLGMEKEIQNHIFDPFFTTKEVGEGTGLGLATVYGIVKQNNGYILVYSEPGQGTTFKIYFPRRMPEKEEQPANRVTRPAPHGARILLVEDDDMVRGMITLMLESSGYQVISKALPKEAVEFFKQKQMSIDLLITDVVMPKMNGIELKKQLKSLQPGLKTLFISGYPSGAIGRQGVLKQGMNFIQKPFSRNEILQKVGDLLK